MPAAHRSLPGSVTAAAGLGALLAASDVLLGEDRAWSAGCAAAGLGFLMGAGLAGVSCWIAALARSVRLRLPQLAPPTVRWLCAGTLLVALLLLSAGRMGVFELYPRASRASESIAFLAATLGASGIVRKHVSGFTLAIAALLALSSVFLVRTKDPRVARALLARPLPATLLMGLRALCDVDRDGYASVLGGGDCAPFDPRISPGSPERPGNGIDDNCLLGDADRAHVSARARITGEPRRAPVSVVLITIDSLRPDHIAPYGPTAATPALAAFAQHAVRFDRAYTSGGWTSLALSSLFRGRYARNLRWTRVFETQRLNLLRAAELAQRRGEVIRKAFSLPLADDHPTLAQLVRAHGVRTAAVVDDGYTRYFQQKRGAFPGFAVYVHLDLLPEQRRNDRGTSDEALRVLRLFGARDPLFLWVHYFGPHSPSTEHVGVPMLGSDQEARYDHEIAYLDGQLSRLLAGLDALATKVPLAVLIASDHGEEFAPTLRYHGQTLREPAIRIPLLLRTPDLAPGQSREPVSLVDVMPTVLNLLGVPAPAELDGSDLFAIASGARPKRAVLVDTWRFDRQHELEIDLTAAIDREHKLVWDVLHDGRSLSRVDDPQERNIWSPQAAGKLEQAVREYLEYAPRELVP